MIGGRVLDAPAVIAFQIDAHALLCARDRGWAMVIGDAARYSVVDGVEIEPLP